MNRLREAAQALLDELFSENEIPERIYDFLRSALEDSGTGGDRSCHAVELRLGPQEVVFHFGTESEAKSFYARAIQPEKEPK